jgi:hypothetical protein
VLQGGNELCRIEGFDHRNAVSELKVSIEAEAGLVSALMRLINPESQVELQNHLTLEDAGMPSKHALTAGVIELHVQKLKKVVVADELQIAPGEVTDSELAELCESIKDDPTDILVLCGCCRITNISCLVQLSTISHLDISSCGLGAEGGFHLQDLANAIKHMGALSKLVMRQNSIHGTEAGKAFSKMLAQNTVLKELDLSSQEGGYGLPLDAAFAKEFAVGISNNGALTSLHVGKNHIPEKEMRKIMAIAMCMESMNTLCGVPFKDKTFTELDISGNNLGTEGTLVVAEYLDGNETLTSLNLASNLLGAKDAKIVADAVKVTVRLRSFWYHFHVHLTAG